jgi:hypothetical protein
VKSKKYYKLKIYQRRRKGNNNNNLPDGEFDSLEHEIVSEILPVMLQFCNNSVTTIVDLGNNHTFPKLNETRILGQ